MHIISLQLRNIRSYHNEHIVLPKGITLLAGDIGAGKSTILLAIEFALFGISRGELTGQALLRHGVSDGDVTLTLQINKQEYTIFRALRRTAQGVTQETGWLRTPQTQLVLTPSELRAKIFTLLGYPLQFLAKQKNLLYRFTLYTPQEEMKQILLQTAEERLEIIRRMFGVDVYRIARDNAQLLAKTLKDKEQEAHAISLRLLQDQTRIETRLAQKDAVILRQQKLLIDREQLQKHILLLQEKMQVQEELVQKLRETQQLHVVHEKSRVQISQEVLRLEQEQLYVMRKLQDMLREQSQLSTGVSSLASSATEDIELLQKKGLAIHEQIEQARFDEGKVLALLPQKSSMLAAGSVCPTCKQRVDEGHVHIMQTMLLAQENAAKKKLSVIKETVAKLKNDFMHVQQTLDIARKRQDMMQRMDSIAQLLLQQQKYNETLLATIEQKKELLKQIPMPDAALFSRIMVENEALRNARSTIQVSQTQLLDVERNIARVEQELHEFSILGVEKERISNEKSRLDTQESQFSALRNWVSRQFSPFTSAVERNVLASIHGSFDAVFRAWFSRLIEDEELTCRIDHAFAPVIMQQGYETDASCLSGGERTAVSLAYRLALVHTIHMLLPNLGTAGMVMLDEPTDGFSSEQLECVRDVLQELRMEQIILVSHEQQLEGFVDHILRVHKTTSGSTVELAA